MLNDIESILRNYSFLIYPRSFRKVNDNFYIFVAKTNKEKYLVIVKHDITLYLSFPYFLEDKPLNNRYLLNLYPLNFENYKKLSEVIPLTPSICKINTSFGTGDRLGLVTSAQLSALKEYSLFPILAQQSPRELIKTKRDFKDVLLKSVLGVLENGYTGSFGADADQIKVV